MRPTRLRRLRTALLLAVVPGLVGIALVRWPTTAGLERSALDLLFILRGPVPPPPDVRVVAIDDVSYAVREVDDKAPWPRALHADLVRTLKAEGAKAVAFDILFLGAGSIEEDLALEAALAEAGNVVLGSSIDVVEDARARVAHVTEPEAAFTQAAAALGEVNFIPDPDGVIRAATPVRDGHPGLALAAYEVATGDRSRRGEGPRLLDYYGKARTIPTASAYQALAPREHLPPGFFRDTLVFVGVCQAAATSDRGKDSFLTPFRGRHGVATYGVEIHATLAGNLLDGRRIRLLPAGIEIAGLLLLPLVASLVFVALGPKWGGAAFALALPAPLLLGWWAIASGGWWVPVTVPTTVQLPLAYGSSLLWYYLTTVREREKIKRAFGFYLAPDMIARIADDPGVVALGGEEIEGTAMFTDLAGFTRMAEALSATETVAILNLYFSETTRHVFDAQGTLVKYIGDAVFAIWNAPLRRPDHAALACRAALAIARGERGREDGLVTRIGVHTGPMVVGNLGSAQRFDYTAIGDAVNLASRLEGLNKAFGTQVLVSGETLRATGDRFVSRSLGRVRVAGRAEPVELHELLGLRDEPAAIGVGPDALARFAQGLAEFAQGRFEPAAAAFRSARDLAGGRDGPSEAFWRWSEGYALAPPDPPWDGVLTFETK